MGVGYLRLGFVPGRLGSWRDGKKGFAEWNGRTTVCTYTYAARGISHVRRHLAKLGVDN